MAAIALIKLTQGPNTDLGGIAVLGTLWDGQVVVTNDNNTDVVAWEIYLRDAPPGSLLSTGLLAAASNNTPMANFLPDVSGSYRVELIVTGPGGVTNRDIRVFAIPFPTGRGLIAPPYQKLPDPLPVLGSGLSGEKPNELNFGGQERGWSGDDDTSRPLLYQLVKEVNDLVDVPDFAAANDDDVLTVSRFAYNDPVAIAVVGEADAWVANSNFSNSGTPGYYPGAMRFIPALDTGSAGGSTTDNDEILVGIVYDGSTYFWVAGYDGVSLDGHVRKMTAANPPTFSSEYVMNVGGGDAASAIDFGEGYIWVTDDAALWRLDPTTPIPGTSVLSSIGLSDVLVDSDTIHYGDLQPRVWVSDTALGGWQRVELSTPAVDATLPITNALPVCLSVGAGYIWSAGNDGATTAATLFRIVPDPIALSAQTTSIDAVAPNSTVLDVLYDTVSGKVFVYLSEVTTNRPLLLRVHPTTLVVEDSVVLALGTASAGGPYPRLSAVDGYILVPVMDPGGTPEVYKVDATDFTTVTTINNYRSVEWEAGGGGAVTLAGDATGPSGSNTVEKIRNIDINPAAPTTTGQVLRYNGSTTRWEANSSKGHDIDNPEQTGSGVITVTADIRVVRCQTSVSVCTVNLTTPVGAGSGFFVTIIDVDGNAATNIITVNPPGGQTINGAASMVISRNRGSTTLYKSGSSTDWSIV